MKKIAHIFLLIYYTFGTISLPMSDFSTLSDLPKMYDHCKATEDKDMTVIDFVTDHLVNIDSLFDNHDNGDEQKPHTPSQNQHPEQSTVFNINYFSFTLQHFHPVQVEPVIPSDNFLPSDYFSSIFRPPNV